MRAAHRGYAKGRHDECANHGTARAEEQGDKGVVVVVVVVRGGVPLYGGNDVRVFEPSKEQKEEKGFGTNKIMCVDGWMDGWRWRRRWRWLLR